MMSDRICRPQRPAHKPSHPQFMSGPSCKRPGYDLAKLDISLLGRSRRAEEATARRREVINLSRQILGIPDTWRLGIIPGSDMGAVNGPHATLPAPGQTILFAAVCTLRPAVPVFLIDFSHSVLFLIDPRCNEGSQPQANSFRSRADGASLLRQRGSLRRPA
jgi:hypothetical protein